MRWILKQYNPIISDTIAQNFSLDPISAILLAQRAGEEYESWINVKHTVPNPKALPDIDHAITTIKQSRYVGIFSDYDADGVTSAVMWQEFLCARGIKTTTYIPNRKVGYGPTHESIQELIARGVDVLLFLDCGTDCHELLTNIKIPIVVIDHHLVKNPSLPVAAFVNPYRTNVTQFLNLCTAALSLLVIAAIDSRYPSKHLYDLAAIGTISDIMPLHRLNRSIVKRGLEYINQGSRPVLAKLVFGNKITSQDVAFSIAPKINAAGRMEHADHALQIFNPNATDEHVEFLINLNKSRQTQEAEILASLKVDDSNPVIVLYDPTWNLGIVGIIAAKIKEQYNKPTFVLTKAGQYLKGSARSTECIDIGQLIQNAVASNIIVNGGGHRCAGGVTLLPEQLENFIEFTKTVPAAKPFTYEIDAVTSVQGLRSITALELLEPFGNGNPAPKFFLSNITIHKYQMIKEIHARISITDGHATITVMAFKITQKIQQFLKGKYNLDMIIEYCGRTWVMREMELANTAQ